MNQRRAIGGGHARGTITSSQRWGSEAPPHGWGQLPPEPTRSDAPQPGETLPPPHTDSSALGLTGTQRRQEGERERDREGRMRPVADLEMDQEGRLNNIG